MLDASVKSKAFCFRGFLIRQTSVSYYLFFKAPFFYTQLFFVILTYIVYTIYIYYLHTLFRFLHLYTLNFPYTQLPFIFQTSYFVNKTPLGETRCLTNFCFLTVALAFSFFNSFPFSNTVSDTTLGTLPLYLPLCDKNLKYVHLPTYFIYFPHKHIT